MENTQNIEKMFDNVSDAYIAAGKQMDEWTLGKFVGLKETYDKYGTLFEKQINLLNSLTKYIPKSPVMKNNYQLKQRTLTDVSNPAQNAISDLHNALVKLRDAIFDNGKEEIDTNEICNEIEMRIADSISKAELKKYALNKTIQILNHLSK
jgi:hypothetical protein